MGNYICSKCAVTASSKCVRQRSVFLTSDREQTILGNMLTIDAVRIGSIKENWRRENDSDKWRVTYTFTADAVPGQDEDEAIKRSWIDRLLLGASKESLKVALCEHKWEPTEECDFGCCVPKVAAE